MPKHKTISISELAKHPERIAAAIEASGAVYQIKRRTGRNMVLMDSQYLESLEATIEFMTAHPNWEAEMEEGRREVAAGRGVTLEELCERYGLDAEGRPIAARRSPVQGASKRRSAKNARSAQRPRARAS